MRFASTIWLWLVPLLPVMWLLMRSADRSAGRRLAQLLGERAATHIERANPRLRSWQRFFFLAGMFWLLLALARPQWGASEVTVTQQGSDIVVALDISNSMLAEDVVPNRMARAKAELGSFLHRLEDSRVGLVFFAGAAFVQCPLTLDYGTADIFLKMAGPDMMSEQGTAIGAALKASRELLAKGAGDQPAGGFQAILLVTDGEDLEDEWEKEARACQDQGIRVIPVGVGEESGGLIPLQDSQGRPAGFMKDEEGNVVMTRMNLAKLEELAAIGGGSTFRLGVDGLAGDRLFAELERLGRRDLEDRRISAYKERFVWPLLLAIFSFAMRLMLRVRHEQAPRTAGAGMRRNGALGLILVVGLAGALLSASPVRAGLVPAERSGMNTGLDHYEAGDYEAALVEFEAALVQAPDNPAIGLAVGETLFQLERYAEAANEFQRVLDLTEDQDLRAEALYNKGTSLLADGDPAQAVENLRRSLQLDPDQKDALFNLEVALQRLKQQEQQEKEEQEKQDQDKKDQEESEQEEQEQEQQDQQDQEQQEQEQQEQEQEQEQQEQQEQQQDEEQQGDKPEENQEQDQEQTEEQPEPELDPRELTKEQQEQILQALDRDEEELKRSVQKRLKGGKPKSGKKW